MTSNESDLSNEDSIEEPKEYAERPPEPEEGLQDDLVPEDEDVEDE